MLFSANVREISLLDCIIVYLLLSLNGQFIEVCKVLVPDMQDFSFCFPQDQAYVAVVWKVFSVLFCLHVQH